MKNIKFLKTTFAVSVLFSLLLFSNEALAKQHRKNTGSNQYQYQTFQEAKKHLTKIYTSNPKYKESTQTFYCHCPIEKKQKGKYVSMSPDLNKCGYISGKYHKRAKHIEWEHIMPASWKGHDMSCWKAGGRKNCRGVPEFIKFEGDMHNLVPAVGEINATREHFRYTENAGSKKSKYGQCHFIVNTQKREAEPASYTRGFIARTFLYMSERHNVKLSKSDLNLMNAWNKRYPPTQWECYRNNKIKYIQHNDNHFITEACNRNSKRR